MVSANIDATSATCTTVCNGHRQCCHRRVHGLQWYKQAKLSLLGAILLQMPHKYAAGQL